MMQLAGQQIANGWRCVLDGIQGDSDFLVNTLRPNSF